VFNLQDKKRSEYSPDDLSRFEASLADYWEKSRSLESHTVNDLEKHLWLANGAAATISIGFIQSKPVISCWQYSGAWIFVIGIAALVFLKYISAYNSSRDRCRFQDAKSRFDAEEVTDHIFRTVRDRRFTLLKQTYLALQRGAGAAFVVGLILTLVGVGSAV